MRYRFAVATVVVALLASACGGDRSGVEVRDAWVRATPPGAGVAAGYVTLINHGSGEARLLAVTTPAAASVEVHTMTIDESGVMRMRQLEEGLPLAGGSEVKMAPGGLHLMLIAPPQPLHPGTSTALTLRFADGSEQTVQAPVRAAGEGAAADEHHH